MSSQNKTRLYNLAGYASIFSLYRSTFMSFFAGRIFIVFLKDEGCAGHDFYVTSQTIFPLVVRSLQAFERPPLSSPPNVPWDFSVV